MFLDYIVFFWLMIRFTQEGCQHLSCLLVLSNTCLHALINFEKQLACIIDTILLKTIRIGMDKNLLRSVEKTLLGKVFTHQLRQCKTRVLTLSRVQEDLSRKITGVLNECRVEFILVCQNKAGLVIESGPVHVHPLSEQIFEIASTTHAPFMEIIRSNLFTNGSCDCATTLVVASHFKRLTEGLLSLHICHH